MPFSKITLEEDEAIKRLSSDEDKPKRFNWEEALNGAEAGEGNVRLQSVEGERTVGLTEIANTVGNALANYCYPRVMRTFLPMKTGILSPR